MKFAFQKWFNLIPCLLLLVMVFAVFIGVVYRYAFNSPLNWPEEVAKLAFTWVVFLGGGIAAARREHIVVETIVDFFPAKVKAVVGILTRLLTIVFLAVVVYTSSEFLWGAIEDTSAAVRISMAWWSLPIPLGCLVIIGYTFVDMMRPPKRVECTDK
jgi:TRAP-type C4-dicarboxylate transport system permease small subunit